MIRKKAPRLAAAFVVTISAGCGGQTQTPTNPDKPPTETGPENPDWVPNIGAVKGGFVKGSDGNCYIEHPANPPWMQPADCETQQPLKKPDEETPKPDAKPEEQEPKPPPVADANLPSAPAGWRIERTSDGACRAFAPSDNCPPGASCNPPPPRRVKCP
jgi:hypothetical protein